MGKFTVTHEIGCDEGTFWRIFVDKEFNTKLYLEHLNFAEFKILEQNETDTTISRKVVAAPRMDAPGPVAKLLGSNFRYTEEGSMQKSEHPLWRWKTTPSVLADKLRTEGTVRVEPIGAGKVRRIAEILIEAKVFGIGGLIESSAEKQLREGWDKSAVFLNKWIAGAVK